MKSILISIQPKWCELIASGKKIVEVRKIRPKIETPFKCYIYCTKGNPNDPTQRLETHSAIDWESVSLCNGKVIGEFVCDEIQPYNENALFLGLDEISCSEIEEKSCVDLNDLLSYKGERKYIYGWHISDLVIYEQPKELREFYRKCEKFACEGCEHLKYQQVNADEYDYECEYFNYHIPITRPPQSWYYVE